MESLYNASVRFQTFEMLCRMVELSEYRMRNLEERTHDVDIGNLRFELGATGFSFGRQAGHTTAIAECLKKYNRNDYSNLVVFHNRPFLDTFSRMYLEKDFRYFNSITLESFVNPHSFRYNKFGPNKPQRIFFDGPAWSRLTETAARFGMSPVQALSQPGVENVKSITWCGQ